MQQLQLPQGWQGLAAVSSLPPICTGRRPKTGGMRQNSMVVPPEKVGADELRQTRLEYFADVQRIKEKRLRDEAAAA